MLLATAYALMAAVLHAGWNLIAKRSVDPFLALWSQFAVAGLLCLPFVILAGGLPLAGWGWAGLTGLIHLPYVVGLSRAYRTGDFSLAYPVARGGGALVAAIGGVLLLGDEFGAGAMMAIGMVIIGLFGLAVGAPRRQVLTALIVALAIGCYTIVDSHASRQYEGLSYVFAVFVAIGVGVTVWGVEIGRAHV